MLDGSKFRRRRSVVSNRSDVTGSGVVATGFDSSVCWSRLNEVFSGRRDPPFADTPPKSTPSHRTHPESLTSARVP